jgi:hypothetical protein
MKIIFVADFKKTWYTAVHYAESFKALGHEVLRIQEPLETLPEGYDFLLWQRHLHRMPNLAEIQKKIKVVSLTLDLYWNLNRESRIGNEDFWMTNLVFSPDGGNDEKFKARGVNHQWLLPAVYHTECSLENLPKKHEIIFVGDAKKHLIEWDYRKKLIQWLKDIYGSKFEVLPIEGQIRGKALNELYNTTKIVIGDSVYSPKYTSDRLYETIGRGGFIIYPEIEGVGLKDGEHYVTYKYGDFKTLKEKIDYYLVNDEEREKIRKQGYEEVIKNHTYLNRCKEILNYVKQ